jgi:hypothetical protein
MSLFVLLAGMLGVAVLDFLELEYQYQMRTFVACNWFRAALFVATALRMATGGVAAAVAAQTMASPDASVLVRLLVGILAGMGSLCDGWPLGSVCWIHQVLVDETDEENLG